MNEALAWFGRIAALLPQLIGLWSAVKQRDAAAERKAAFDLARAIEDRQAWEEINGG